MTDIHISLLFSFLTCDNCCLYIIMGTNGGDLAFFFSRRRGCIWGIFFSVSSPYHNFFMLRASCRLCSQLSCVTGGFSGEIKIFGSLALAAMVGTGHGVVTAPFLSVACYYYTTYTERVGGLRVLCLGGHMRLVETSRGKAAAMLRVGQIEAAVKGRLRYRIKGYLLV
ncbi:hypothetical protein QBC34DRAFT_110395 [Podospora aff. communis PSN243]|uniref:Uncharacterized protein n=1 Tax=Podospora aff. communis PSN243 TaxID=3040156 RepID=A0AAV9GKV8_9PEZI|nr:hypothetical protein QBC34DRAFT_110395 [Podospora aff. communis PSN243]